MKKFNIFKSEEIREYFRDKATLNLSKYVDFIIKTGLRTGNYHQKYYLGGYNTNWVTSEFDVFIYDGGYKGINLGYEIGAELRLQFCNFIISPSVILISNDLNSNSFSALNLKLGYQL